VAVKEYVVRCAMTKPQAKVYSAVARSREVVAALSGEGATIPPPAPASNGLSTPATTPPPPTAASLSAAKGGPATTGAGAGGGAMEEALLALRRAALTGALEKPPPPGALLSAGQAEAQKEEFWRGHVKDLELSVPERLEKYSGKLAKLGRAVARLAAAGKKVLVLGALPDARLLVHQYLVETDVPHECWE
ncbi:unnamed protein product, partial [Ectocarpus sp. 8 AP-2014]